MVEIEKTHALEREKYQNPIKFTKVIQGLNIKLKIPTQVESILEKKKKSIFIKNYESFKNYLIDS